METKDTALNQKLFETLADTSAEGDLSDHASRHEAGSFLRHSASLAMTKTADGLIDPKLVLAWMLTAVGAPAALTGLLVPVREAGALLPQLFTSGPIQRMARRKWAWVGGSAVQGIAALGIAIAAVTLSGIAAGMTVVALLGVLALARSVCSVSYKDILGKTVGKSRRGSATGLASSVSSAAVIVFALTLMFAWVPRFSLVVGAIGLASLLWIAAAALFSTLREEPTESAEAAGGWREAIGQMRVLREDGQLVRFIVARGLLVGTALAPPYLVILASQSGQAAFDALGALVLASSIASFLSSYIWGRLADRSSRQVLMLAGLAAALALGLALLAAWAGVMGTFWAAPVILFFLMISYNGVRQGRSTYLVDMSPQDARAQYTAVSNTVIGIVLLGSGIFGAIASSFGAELTIALFAVMSIGGAIAAWTLDEVQKG
ncbi:MAG: MFS transporter [Rhodobacteraceae bacterium]|nr:MFS transporter [Paracoccaceae bacterium]